MQIKRGDPTVEDLFVTLDGAVIGHLLEADEEAGYVIQQLPQQPPVRLDGTVVVHRPALVMTPELNEALAATLERITTGIHTGKFRVEAFTTDTRYNPDAIDQTGYPHIVRADLTLVYVEA